MDATCTIQDSIHVFRLVHKYVSRILGTYQFCPKPFLKPFLLNERLLERVFFFHHTYFLQSVFQS